MAQYNFVRASQLPQHDNSIVPNNDRIVAGVPLRENYIQNTGIRNYYITNSVHFPNQSPLNLLRDGTIYGGMRRLVPLLPGINNTEVNIQTYTEFLQFLEVEIHSYIQNAAYNNMRRIPDSRQSMMSLLYNLSTTDSRTRFLSNAMHNINNVSTDIKLLINGVFSSIVAAYRGSDLFSRFLSRFNLLDYEGANEVRWFHRLNRDINISPALRLLVQIVLLRFPSTEVRVNDYDSNSLLTPCVKEDENGRIFAERNLKYEILQNHKRNLSFYYLPNIQRVVGVWPKQISVKNSPAGQDWVNLSVNYQVDLIRNCIIQINVEDGWYPDFDNLFRLNWNIYNRIRQQNPFNLPDNVDKRSRLYVTLSIYGQQNLPLYFVPWILEGSLNSGRSHDVSNFIEEYEYQLQKNYGDREQNIDERYNNQTFYLHFTWLYDENNVDNSRLLADRQPVQQRFNQIGNDVDEFDDNDYEDPDNPFDDGPPPALPAPAAPAPRAPRPPARRGLRELRALGVNIDDVIARNNGAPRPRARRGTRELRALGVNVAPPARNTRTAAQNNSSRTRSGRVFNMRVGAPYTGTLKEKHFFEASMINKFTNSAALLKTPETYLNCCLMMSLIRAQLYCYSFKDGNCESLKITGTKHPSSKCRNMYIESINNYDDAPYPYPFIEKIDGKWYIKLFEPGKLKINDKFVAGVRDEHEEKYWLQASEEVLFHLQQYFKKDLDYNNVEEYCQAFSDYFKVCISLYDIETRSSRIHVFRPDNMLPREIITKYKHLLMVHIVYDQGHAHSVSSFPSFVKRETRKDELRLYNYCPICEEQQIKELRSTSEESFKHISKCCQKKDFIIKREDMIEKMICTNIERVKTQYRKINKKTKIVFQCTQCYEDLDQMTWMQHDCYIRKKAVNSIEESKIYVYDLEACQIKEDGLGLLKHECNCLYSRKVYCENEEEEQGMYFKGEFEFIEDLISSRKYENCVFIAHNGGSYDIHFLLRVLERCEVQHTFVPSPTSKHKFIQITITHDDLNIRFIDFMRFVPGSLKRIAESFEIPVSKGDFPHRFNNGEHDNYVGRIPPLHDPNDWWNFNNARSEKDKAVFTKWHNDQSLIYCTCENECTCNKMKWDFQIEIKKYCLLDVVVLGEVVKAYRNACMNFDEIDEKMMNWSAPRLDPLQFMTLPQITISTFVNGFETMNHPDYDFKGIYTLSNRQRGGLSDEAVMWLYNLQKETHHKIYYLGNSNKEWYDFDLNLNIDGYCPETNTVYLFLDCDYWGCPMCHIEKHETNEKIPERGMYASDVRDHLEYLMCQLNQKYAKVNYIWSHDFKRDEVPEYIQESCCLFEPEEAFYGGRCEVFKPFCKPEDGEELQYIDVCSLYPSVYAGKPLPLGKPNHMIGENIERIRLDPNHPNRYFGFVKCHVTPNKKDLLGLLPKRDEETGRLFFPVNPMTGCWFTEEIYLAMQNGYIINEIYEVYHWDERNRSDQHLRPYVDYFFRMKQEAEGWKKLGASSDNPTEEEKDEIVERLYIQNGRLGRIRKEKVEINPVLRALAKLYLNSLWGKLAQKRSKSCNLTVYGSQQLLDLINNPHVLLSSCKFREIAPGEYKVHFDLKEEYAPSVKHGNLFIGAAVTAWARCVLHSKMLVIGPKNIIYCDTDSIVLIKKAIMGILTDVGLGKWTDEYPKYHILQIYALAPKLYSLMLQLKSNENETYESFRAKGVQLTLANQAKLAFNNIKPLIENLITGKNSDFAVEVNNFSIFTNSTNNRLPFGRVYTRDNIKKIRGIISKRFFELVNMIDWEVVSQIQTYPFGYDLN